MRLIDADKVTKPIYAEEDNITGFGMTYDEMDAYNNGIDASWSKIELAPTVDAVEVVRCKNCKHRKSVWHKDGRMKDGGYYYCYCELDTGDPFELGREAEEDDWFCADGERKEVTHEET